MRFNPSAWYWTVGGSQIYSSASNAVVASTDATYEAWVAAGGSPTALNSASDLDGVLARFGLPASGLDFANVQWALVTACAAACGSVMGQVYGTDPNQAATHQSAAQNAAGIVRQGGNAAPASGSTYYAEFLSYAQSWGYSSGTLANFATLVVTLTQQSLALSGALRALEVSAAAATTSAELATALSTFETAIGAVVTAINAASPPVPISAPAAITIKGINA